MSPLGSHRRVSVRGHFKPMIYGGWGDYQEWADHDFMPRPGPTGKTTDQPSSVELPTAEMPMVFIDDEDEPAVVALEPPPEAVDTRFQAELIVRPYVRTGGRASSKYDLRLETMVMTTWGRPADRPLEFSDIGRICSLCEIPLSVAELSAYLKAPLGVVRVLVGDAINRGLVLVQENEADALGCPSMDVLRRVHEGLCGLP